MDNVDLVKEIIKNNIYLTLSTTDGKLPWATPVRYFVDSSYNFYFISSTDSLHAKNIVRNANVSFAVFDSHQRSGTGREIQVSGTAEVLTDSIPEEVAQRFKGVNPANRVFRIKPMKFYIPDDASWENEKLDKRMEVMIK